MKVKLRQLSTILLAFIISLPAFSQAVPETSPFIGKNSVLTYKVEEDHNRYNFIVTITSLDENGDIAFDWKTNEASPRKGHSSMKYSNLDEASSLLLKVPRGNETLGADDTRIFLSDAMTKDISDHLAEFQVDGNKQSFIFVKKSETKKINYDNAPTELDYHYGDGNSAYIGVFDIGKLSVAGYYYSHGFEIELVSINNQDATRESVPVEKKEKGEPKKMGTIDLIFAKVMWPTLAKIEEYDPTEGGKVKQPFHETYDYRLESNGDVPPSYVDVFVVDLKYIYEHKAEFPNYIKGNFTIGEKDFPEDEVMKVINVFMNVSAKNLYGYRPWADQQFVKSLTADERKKLANECASYVMMYGFKEK